MTQPQEKSGGLSKALKLFFLIVVVLLVPLVMDQVELDPEKVRLAGRVAVGFTLLLFVYGIFSKVLKLLGFVAFALIVFVFLVAEGHVKAPRAASLFEKVSERDR